MSANQNNTLLQCYNRCCGQSFDPLKNEPDSCCHHPGDPVFHDAYKGWSCCNKKTTDFTEFLNIKGCTNSYHSNIKPLETTKPEKEVEMKCDKNEKTNMHPPPIKKEGMSRPSPNTPMHLLMPTIGSSLKSLLLKMEKAMLNEKVSDNPANIAINTPCKHGGCKQVYNGEDNNLETCIYHPGVPIFHEGLKYWTCCLKKTTDFDSFLEQVGCTIGDHLWFKQQSEEEKATPCRYDWHQTANSVVISVFSKCPIPDLCVVEANPVKLCLHIVFGEERKLFKTEFLLYGVIEVDKSFVSYLGSKVEISLRKAEPLTWNTLIISKCANQETNDSVEEDKELDITT